MTTVLRKLTGRGGTAEIGASARGTTTTRHSHSMVPGGFDVMS